MTRPAAMPRRTVLRVLAAAAALPAGAFALGRLAPAPRPVRWSGTALGGLASLTLWHPDPARARRALGWVAAELERLEGLFSLYRPESAIARLNRDGQIARPDPAFLAVLGVALRLAQATAGAFDPTVQPLWLAHARAGSAPASDAAQRQLDGVRRLVDHTAVEAGKARIAFGRDGMALTLNAVAQGYVTDRITDLLRNDGFDHALVQLGETRALGAGPDGEGFAVHIADPARQGHAGPPIALRDAALAVSAGDAGGPVGRHILDPHTGEPARGLRLVAVLAPTALWADGLSTAICAAGPARAAALLALCRGASARLTGEDGRPIPA